MSEEYVEHRATEFVDQGSPISGEPLKLLSGVVLL